MKNMNTIKTPLASARGLGSAHDGVHHWVMQRVTAVAAALLCLWLAWSGLSMPGWNYETFTAWQAAPPHAVLTILAVIAIFYHASLGIQVILEDYVHQEFMKFAAIRVNQAAFFAAAVACVFSVLKIALAH